MRTTRRFSVYVCTLLLLIQNGCSSISQISTSIGQISTIDLDLFQNTDVPQTIYSVMITERTNVYRAPSLDEYVTTKIPTSTQLLVLEQQEEWIRIHYENFVGWVLDDEIVQISEQRQYGVMLKESSLYAFPSLETEVVSTLFLGDVLVIEGTVLGADWFYLRDLAGIGGFVQSSDIQLTEKEIFDEYVASLINDNLPAFKTLYGWTDLVTNLQNSCLVELYRTKSSWKHPTSILFTAFSESGNELITVNEEYVQLYNLYTRESIQKSNYRGIVESVLFSPDGFLLKISGRWDRRLFDLYRFIPDPSLIAITALAYSQDGRYALIATSDKNLWLYDRHSAQVIQRWEQESVIKAVGFSLDERQVVSGDAEGFVYLYSIETGEEINQWSIGQGEVSGVRFIDDQVLATWTYKEVGLYDVVNRKNLRKWTYRNWIKEIKFSQDSQRFLVLTTDNRLALHDINLEDTLFIVNNLSLNGAFLFSPLHNDHILFTLSQNDEYLLLAYDVQNREVLYSWLDDERILTAAFSADGKNLLIGGQSTVVRLYDVPYFCFALPVE